MQVPFGGDDFAANPNPRCACVLLLDVSGSMSGEPMRQLNLGLQAFKQDLAQDQVALSRAEIATVTFGPVNVLHDFVTADAFEPMELSPQGDTPMGAAIVRAVQLVEARKSVYRQNGVMHYRPWIFLITDGAPTDKWQAAAMAVREGEAADKFSFFAVGVRGANMEVLSQISTREPVLLDGLRFRELFMWLSASMRQRSASTLGTEVVLRPTTGPNGWTTA